MDSKENHVRVAPDVASVSELAGRGSSPGYSPSQLIPPDGEIAYGKAFHPLAELFPLIDGRELEELADDIAEHGQREPIILLDGMILDGRNRYLACQMAGVEPHFEQFGDAADPLAAVISLNLKRRHLNESQRAMIAARLATLDHGQRQTGKFAAVPTQAQAAKKLDVSERSLRSAREVLLEGAPELVAAVDKREVAVSAAAGIVTLPKAEQVEIVARGEREILAAAKQINSVKAKQKAVARSEHEKALGAKIAAMPGGVYGVIYADPPWRFEPRSRETGMDRAADNHYPTMTLGEIKAFAVPAADDAILFMWATLPILPHALDVMNAWSFTYKSACIWSKDQVATGYWFRNKNEILLVGTRGKVPAPAPGTQFESEIRAPVGAHSAKPAAFRQMIETMFPSLPKIELFARGQAAPGWDVWGNEAEQ